MPISLVIQLREPPVSKPPVRHCLTYRHDFMKVCVEWMRRGHGQCQGVSFWDLDLKEHRERPSDDAMNCSHSGTAIHCHCLFRFIVSSPSSSQIPRGNTPFSRGDQKAVSSLANVPSSRLLVHGNIRMYPRFCFMVQGTIRQHHPFGNQPLANPRRFAAPRNRGNGRLGLWIKEASDQKGISFIDRMHDWAKQAS